MRKYRLETKYQILLLLTLFISLSFVFLNIYTQIAYTGVNDNIDGYAWNSNLGWISANCTNNASCGTSDYGVNLIPGTLNLEGYFWSPNVGWISLESSNTPPDNYAFADNGGSGGCQNWCDGSNNCTACYDSSNGNIYGWAQVLALGDEGWIRLHASGTPVYDGVSVDQSTGEFRGWGWNGNDDGSGIGWISFNCRETSNCGVSDYKVKVANLYFPEARDLSAPNWSTIDACSDESLRAFLSWDFYDEDVGATQSYYHVIVSQQNSTSSGVIIDTGKTAGVASQLYISNASLLDYDTSYYWFVKVWDEFGFESAWAQFDTLNGVDNHILTDNIARNNVVSPDPELTFTTFSREFPDINFTFDPAEPVKDEALFLTDSSDVYTDGSPAVSSACTEATCSWLWSGTGIRTNTTPTASTTEMTFDYGNNDIELLVTDSQGYACSSTQSLFVDLAPDWKEIKAE